MWSSMIIRSPILKFGFIPPEALDTKKRFDSKLIHYTLGKCDLLHIVSLVIVEPTLHRHYILTAQLAEEQLAGVTLDSGNREIGYILIWECV